VSGASSAKAEPLPTSVEGALRLPPTGSIHASIESSGDASMGVEPAREANVTDMPAALTLPRKGAEDELGLISALSLETRLATTIYWCSVLALGGALFIPRLLPCVDYPQHLALADIARRLANPNAPEQATHVLNIWTYNGLFHLIVAQLSRILPIELAGRLVVSGSLVLLGGATLALLRWLGRPGWLAALFVPAIFSFAVGWGFVNYALGTALAVTALALIARALRKPSFTLAIAIAVVGMACAMTHVLATLLLCLLAAALAPEVSLAATREGARGIRHLGRAFLRSTLALAPLAVACVYCIAVYREQYAWNPGMYRDATLEGSAPPIWQKILYFGAFTTGLHADHTDQALLWLGLATLAIAAALGAIAVRRDHATVDRTTLWLPLAVALIAYLMTPMVFVGTHLIFPRLTQAVVLGAVLATPAVAGRTGAKLAAAALVIALSTGINAIGHAALYAAETDDASRVIDDMPAGRRATAVVYGADTFAYRSGALVHLAAYYGARKHGDWAFSFARYLSVPVRFRPGGGPPWPKIGWEFNASDYNPRCKYAHTFDLVVVRAPRDLPTDASGEQSVRRAVFKQDAAAVRLISHHGGFWAFDAAGLPDDGTF
jgi:hypothetical protein